MTEVLEFTIDELAAKLNIPSRTIRYYQSKRVLPKPRLAGRTALYCQEHIERLNWIGQLKDRGLSIKAIRNLCERVGDDGISADAWLGVEDVINKRWNDEEPIILSEEALLERIGPDRTGRVASLEAVGVVERKRSHFLVPSPRILDLALQLDRAGVSLETSHDIGELLHKHLSKLVEESIAMLMKRAGDGFGQATERGIANAMDALRPAANEALLLYFSRIVEDELKQIPEGKYGKLRTVTASKDTNTSDQDADASS